MKEANSSSLDVDFTKNPRPLMTVNLFISRDATEGFGGGGGGRGGVGIGSDTERENPGEPSL